MDNAVRLKTSTAISYRDYSLCVICQLKKKEGVSGVKSCKKENLTKLRNSVSKRYEYLDVDNNI